MVGIFCEYRARSILSFLRKRVKNPHIHLKGALVVCLLLVGLGCDGSTGFLVVDGKPAFVSSAPLERIVRPIPGADANSFKALDSTKNSRALYAVDHKRVYIGYLGQSMPIEGADPATFEIRTPDGKYCSDAARVYWYGIEIMNADPKTFQVRKSPYAIDKNRAYCGLESLEVDSPENFEVLLGSKHYCPIQNRNHKLVPQEEENLQMAVWSRDNSTYFWGASKLAGIDYASFKVLNELYGKDKDKVYFRGNSIPEADAASFISIGVIGGQDANWEYKHGRRVAEVER